MALSRTALSGRKGRSQRRTGADELSGDPKAEICWAKIKVC